MQNFVKFVHWRLLGKWVKYNENFSRRPPDRFSRAMARTTRPRARVKPFWERKFKVNIQSLKNVPLSRKLGPKTDFEIFGQKRSYVKCSPITGP